MVLVPVAIGMRPSRATAFADRMDKPVRILSAVVLAPSSWTIVAERENLGYLADVGLPALLFCLISLTAGFFVPRASGWCSVRRSPARSRSASTTAPWRSRSRSASWGSVELAVPAPSTACSFPVAALFG